MREKTRNETTNSIRKFVSGLKTFENVENDISNSIALAKLLKKKTTKW